MGNIGATNFLGLSFRTLAKNDFIIFKQTAKPIVILTFIFTLSTKCKIQCNYT